MSTQHQHSRKSFIAKLLGLGAAAGMMPGLAALARRPGNPRAADTAGANRKKNFAIRPDTRSISRTDMS